MERRFSVFRLTIQGNPANVEFYIVWLDRDIGLVWLLAILNRKTISRIYSCMHKPVCVLRCFLLWIRAKGFFDRIKVLCACACACVRVCACVRACVRVCSRSGICSRFYRKERDKHFPRHFLLLVLTSQLSIDIVRKQDRTYFSMIANENPLDAREENLTVSFQNEWT